MVLWNKWLSQFPLQEDGSVDGFLNEMNTSDPQLVGFQMETQSIPQVFLVIDKSIILECQSVVGADPLMTLLAAHYAFNLKFKTCHSDIFRFISQHVLGKPPRRKTYAYRTLENNVLQKLKNK